MAPGLRENLSKVELKTSEKEQYPDIANKTIFLLLSVLTYLCEPGYIKEYKL